MLHLFYLQLKRRAAEEVRELKATSESKLEDVGGNLRKQVRDHEPIGSLPT